MWPYRSWNLWPLDSQSWLAPDCARSPTEILFEVSLPLKVCTLSSIKNNDKISLKSWISGSLVRDLSPKWEEMILGQDKNLMSEVINYELFWESLSLFFTLFLFCKSEDSLMFRQKFKDQLLLAQWTNLIWCQSKARCCLNYMNAICADEEMI